MGLYEGINQRSLLQKDSKRKWRLDHKHDFLLRACSMDIPLNQKVNKANIGILHFQDFVGISCAPLKRSGVARSTGFASDRLLLFFESDSDTTDRTSHCEIHRPVTSPKSSSRLTAERRPSDASPRLLLSPRKRTNLDSQVQFILKGRENKTRVWKLPSHPDGSDPNMDFVHGCQKAKAPRDIAKNVATFTIFSKCSSLEFLVLSAQGTISSHLIAGSALCPFCCADTQIATSSYLF
ncbi:hypothetical protein HAX54_043861 [Datura stramonium]|uniref:Uncharacterized protein n=1 Tax=Datura stramonium TaxID=4076 RepID=A0ABS8W3N5_DATST|nr:hypothetical protein [Datura stramonium]